MRHYLIESNASVYRLKGCKSEPVYGNSITSSPTRTNKYSIVKAIVRLLSLVSRVQSRSRLWCTRMCSRRARCRVAYGCRRGTCSPQMRCSRRYSASRVRPTAACACRATARTPSSCPPPLASAAAQWMRRARIGEPQPKSTRPRVGTSRASAARTCRTRTRRARSRSQAALPPCPAPTKPTATCIAAGLTDRRHWDLLNTYTKNTFN